MMDALPFGIAHHMALIPLAWLAGLRARGRRRDAAWWWLAGAFAVSWLADTAAHWVDPWLIGLVYPVSQSALVAAVLLDRREAAKLLAVLLLIGVGAALWHGVQGPDVLLRTVAWGAIAGIAFDRWELGRLRMSLLVTFGLGLIAWMGYAIWPGWTSWLVYQGARAFGIGLFCWAAFRPVALSLSRRSAEAR